MSNRQEKRSSSTAGTATNLADRLDLLEPNFRPPRPDPQNQVGGTIASAGIPHQDISQLEPLGSPSLSHHSVGFDGPNSHSSPRRPDKNNKNSDKNPSASLQAVNLAAEQHIRKIAAMEQQDTNSNIYPALSNASSYQTVKRSHQSQAKNNKVVKESPPEMIDLPDDITAVNPTNSPRALVMKNNINNNNNSSKTSSKRKSTPVKLNAPNKQKRRQSSSNINTKTTNDNASEGPRKRTRLHFSANNSKNNQSASSDGKQQKENNGKGSQAASTGTMVLTSSNSRSNHTPVRTTSSKHKAPKNNRLIRDFFSANRPSANKKATAAPPPQKLESFHYDLTSAAAQQRQQKGNATTSDQHRTPPRSKSTAQKASSNKYNGNNRSTPSPIQQVAQLQQKCRQLEVACQEKDEQLKAIHDTRTIRQAAAIASLKKAKAEFAAARKNYHTYRDIASGLLEDLMRQKALAEAQATRERLAADADRIGRLFYTRTSVLASIENWEDGTASKRLQERTKQLLEKKKKLQARLDAAATNNQQQNVIVVDHDDGNEEGKKESEGGTNLLVPEGQRIQTKLEALDAVESVRFHLHTIEEQLQDLKAEEDQLKQEQVEYLRALKRLNSEDVSQYKDRPKLNDRYIMLSLLGKGGFSEVWKAFDVLDLEYVAVKVHFLNPHWKDEKKESYTKHVSREYEIHRSVDHPRIVSLFDVFEIDKHSFGTVLELCEGTDLETVLKQKKRLPERSARAILLQILCGMNYLSQPSADGKRRGIVHYDLKPGNILFNAEGDVMITDFGLSKVVEHEDPSMSMELTSQGAGTYWYLPPECFEMDEEVTVRISNKVDVFSIGVVYYQMLFGKRPFGEGKSQGQLLNEGIMLKLKPVKFPAGPDEPEVSTQAKDFIRRCLQPDQVDRPTVAEICEDPYVTSSTNF